MAYKNILTVEGFLAKEPEFKFLPSGLPVVNFSIADNDRYRDKDTGKFESRNTTWFNVRAFGGLAENIAETLHKGMPVVIEGYMVNNRKTDAEGKVIASYWEVVANKVSLDLRYAKASGITRPEKKPAQQDYAAPQQQYQQPVASPAPATEDPWVNNTDEPPF